VNVMVRSEWPGFRCPQDEHGFHAIDRMGSSAFCLYCFKHFDLADFILAKQGAAWVESRRLEIHLN